jgi:hypothetical protein
MKQAAPSPTKSRPWLLTAGKSHRPGSRVQRQIRRAFAAHPGEQLPTGVLLSYCYPRIKKYRRGHYRSVWRAALKVAVCLGRLPNARGRPNVWIALPADY